MTSRVWSSVRSPRLEAASSFALLTNEAFALDQPECQIKVFFIFLVFSPPFSFFYLEALMGLFNDETTTI